MTRDTRKFKHSFERIVITNRWRHPWFMRPSDWTIIGIGQRFFDSQEYEIIIALFGIDIRIWMKQKRID